MNLTKNMPLFVAAHKWKPEDDRIMLKELDAGFTAMLAGKTPRDVKLHLTYSFPQEAYCVWEAPSKDALEKQFDTYLPTLKKFTEFVPVLQMYPPTMEYVVAGWQQMIQASSR